MDRVEFKEAAVQEYLDRAIVDWRGRRDSSEPNSEDHAKATHYIDAYQSMRVSLFGSVLPDQHIGDPYAQTAEEWSGGDTAATMPPEHGTLGDPTRQ